MRFTGRFIAILLAVLLLLTVRPVLAAGPIRIDKPKSGEILRGQVMVMGSSAVEDFQSAELSFAAESSPADWFLIKTSSTPVESGELAAWDTAVLADGAYRLRLTVYTKDGGSQEALATGLMLKNGGTPTPRSAITPAGAPQSGFALLPTPTRGAKNPVTVGELDLSFYLIRGVIIILIVFGVFALYAAIRSFFRDR